jgi:RHS repeat-associated protein
MKAVEDIFNRFFLFKILSVSLRGRVKKLASGRVTLYHYDYAGNLIAETDGNGTPLRDYVYLNGERIAMKVYGPQAGWYYFVNDHLGTPQKIVDSSGNVVWEAAYLSFGEAQVVTEIVESNFRFPGQYFDAETGLHYNWHRYYDPKTGRYLTPDPIGLEGGVNLYVYVLNNPINRTDLLGLRTAVIITTDFLLLLPIGSHAAVYIDNNGAPAIYDPAGSYGDRSAVGSADIITGPAADLNKYIRYHLEAGSKVSVFYFYTTPSEEAAIFKQADELGGASPGFCAISVRNAVNSIGPFKNLGTAWIPDILYWVMRDIQNRK